MTPTKYHTKTNRELLREVDTSPSATELEKELALRLEQRMRDDEFKPAFTRYVE